MTELNWNYQIKVNGETVETGSLSTFDFSFPISFFNQRMTRYEHGIVIARNSEGEIYEKDF